MKSALEANPESRRLRELSELCSKSAHELAKSIDFDPFRESSGHVPVNSKLDSKCTLLQKYVQLCFQNVHTFIKQVWESQ
jgi:hypothetical protein